METRGIENESVADFKWPQGCKMIIKKPTKL
jgi:hypothetical protein